MNKSPAFQFYPKQWLGDDMVMLMDWDARAMHMHFMCIAWQQHEPCTLPNDDDDLKKWVGSPPEWERLKKQIFRAWKLNEKGDRWIQEGLLREYTKQKDYAESRKKNAEKRWGKADAHAKDMQCTGDALLLQSSSSSSSLGKELKEIPPDPLKGERERDIKLKAESVLEYLNTITGKSYRPVEATLKHIAARIREGATVEECRRVIDGKKKDPYFIENPKFMNPETLFRPSNFEKYRAECEKPPATLPPRTGSAILITSERGVL